MSLAIKLFLITIFFPLLLTAQDTIPEPHKNQYVATDPETVFFVGEFFRGYSVNNSSWENYSQLGFGLDFNWFVFPFLTIGAQYNFMGGNLKEENISNTGRINRINSHYFGLHLGYYHAFNKEWNLHSLAGFGRVQNGSRAPDSRFTEDGNSLMLRSELGYRLDKTAAIFIKATLRWDRMEIDTPPVLNDYFNKQSLLLVGFGVRLHLQNPDG
ncbi:MULTISPECIES: autotransporter domain-containing protein [Salegentibacter]|jgi:hypothetical protein|uniref:Uncharacterized protein n=1 Tax=Salegentibacter agarivorans TaxID=345907 RepID=A0A1I2M0F2_9FLAO|nr:MULTISPECIES: autotransporter domain-containing protein [Salegentibacter]APS38232.1 hypothetical protein AO058_04730 [Salegentibacter sp. T436]SFF84983.1 hypothetical protein SAMN04488033_11158 [Salegentibacter agarivorans]